MKAVRIVQIVLLLALAGYLVLLHNANPTYLILPFLLPLPPVVVLLLTLLLGWLFGWLPGRLALWRLTRELRKSRGRVAELEQHRPAYDSVPLGTPIIPDRQPPRRTEDEESENL